MSRYDKMSFGACPRCGRKDVLVRACDGPTPRLTLHDRPDGTACGFSCEKGSLPDVWPVPGSVYQAEIFRPVGEAGRLDRVRFTYRSRLVAGTVVQVKKNGVRTVELDKNDWFEEEQVDVRPPVEVMRPSTD